MKYVKMLALAAVAAGALMAFIGAGTASASVFCSTATNPCTSRWPNTTVDFSLASGTSAEFREDPGETLNTCKASTVKGTLITGSSTATTKGPVEKANLTWGSCTFPTTSLKGATLEFHALASGNATVTGSGYEVTIQTFLFGSCVYGTGEGKDLGTLTEGNPATFHVDATVNKISGFCPGTSATWLATYTLTEPSATTLYVSES